nr:sulfatase-like hydrolase/transferase [Aestuariivirga litoralis]
MSEADAIKSIRNFAGLPQGAEWADDTYPLIYRWREPPAAPAVKPDIFVFVVESMRGESLKPTNPGGQNLVSVPAIEDMAAHGVVFQHFLSNGFPSGPGFVGISSGAWMHPVKRLDAAYPDTAFDRLGSRLRSDGYHTGVITYDVRYDDKTRWVYNVFEDVVDGVAKGLPSSDAVTADEFIKWVGAADGDGSNKPIFGMYFTKEPHLPYAYQDDSGGWTFGKDLAVNYAHSIHGMDAQLARVFAALKQRARWKDTVVIILGDHANFLNQGTSTGQPVNDTNFTGAIISGGSAIIGQPRINQEPSSQSDIATTVLALAGDWRPAMTLGRDLLSASPARPPRALAIRNGGSRLDVGLETMMLPGHSATRAVLTPSLLPSVPGTQAMPPAGEVADAIRIWAWLIEHNRVWNPDVLK